MSKNNFFYQSPEKLSRKREEMLRKLVEAHFQPWQISWFEKAYDFFIIHPSGYDGATMSQDLHDIAPDGAVNGLEFASMLHDYLYVVFKVSTDRTYMKKADKVMKRVMYMNSNAGWEISRRMFALWIIRWKLTFWRLNVEKREAMTKRDKIQMEVVYAAFAKA